MLHCVIEYNRKAKTGADMDVTGHLDLCGPALVEGWVYWSHEPGRKMKLQVFIDDVLLGECVADRLRPDLRDAGMGDGHCAFSFAIPPQARIEDFTSVKLRVAGSVLYLLPDGFTSFPGALKSVARVDAATLQAARFAKRREVEVRGTAGRVQS